MEKFIALLRGINVGGHKKFPKADQLKMLSALGFQDSQVYLHTGNWIFNSSESSSNISAKIEKVLTETYDWEVPVLVLNASELEEILNKCPFSEEVKVQSYFMILKTGPTPEKISAVEAIHYPNEEFRISTKCIYYYCTKGYGQAKMSGTFFEKKLGVAITARNYNTMKRILDMTLE